MKQPSRRERFPLVLGGAAALTLACTCRLIGDLGGFANEMRSILGLGWNEIDAVELIGDVGD